MERDRSPLLKSIRATVDIGGMATRLRNATGRDRPLRPVVPNVGSLRDHSSARPKGRDDLPAWLLRMGLAFVFLYAGAAMIINPLDFMGYIPTVIGGRSATILLHAFAVYEFVLAAALLSRRFAYHASLAAVLTLTTITLTNLGSFEVLFRNVAIAFAAASLAVQVRRAGPTSCCINTDEGAPLSPGLSLVDPPPAEPEEPSFPPTDLDVDPALVLASLKPRVSRLLVRRL